jgi:hypothetical protein
VTPKEYHALPDALRAAVAVKTLKELGVDTLRIKPRELEPDEIATAEAPTPDMKVWADEFRIRWTSGLQ